MKSFLLALCLVGCHSYGPELSEPAEVDSLAFVPEGHGSGMGYTTSGHLTVVSEDIPARYAVVFRCQHGKFVVQGDDERHKALWAAFREHDPVTVYYRKELDGNGRVVALDFVRAVKRVNVPALTVTP